MAEVSTHSAADAGASESANSPPVVTQTFDTLHYTLFPKEFRFKKVVDPDTKRETKRPPVSLQIPVLTPRGLSNFMAEDAKVSEFVLNAVNDLIIEYVRELVNSDEAPVNVQNDLDFNKIDAVTLANLPPSEARGRGIAKEIWDAWAVDYRSVMMANFAKTSKACDAALSYFLKRCQTVKSEKKMLAKLDELLTQYASVTMNLEDFTGIVEFLAGKIKVFSEDSETARAEAL